MVPAIAPATAFFWGSDDGRLRMLRCATCGRFTHPPGPVCRHCLSPEVAPQELSGRGEVYTFTVNHQAWSERLLAPYTIAIVELAEEPGLRLLTNIVDCPPDEVRIGMPVEVVFEDCGEVHLP